MATIQVEVPDETFVSVRRSPEEVATEMKVSIAVHPTFRTSRAPFFRNLN